MGLIFNSDADDQVGAMSNAAMGWTWHYRFAKAKWVAYGIISTITGIITTALVDYAIVKGTDYAGIVGWLLG